MSANHGGASKRRLGWPCSPLFGPVWALGLHGGRKKGPIDRVTETILKPRAPTLPLAFGGIRQVVYLYAYCRVDRGEGRVVFA